MRKFIFVWIVVSAVILQGCQNDDNEVILAGISLSKELVYLRPAEIHALSVTFFPENASNKNVVWSSSDPTIAKVENGSITALGIGYATITATSVADNDLVKTCIVGVMSDEVKTVAGNVEGVWAMGTMVNVTGHVTVPAGKSLTIEEGCEIIFTENEALELYVEGNLYCKGTEEHPVLFTVSEVSRTEANAFEGLWGGIVFGKTCEEVLIDHAIIEYTGGTITATSPSLATGYKIADGDPQCAILGGKLDGKYVITNSIIRYSVDNAFYLWGGKYIIANNLIVASGSAGGGDAIAPKSGCTVDACFNVIFGTNTNGLKLSSSGESGAIGQGLTRAYNNTLINNGWRRASDKGGSIYVEKNALASVFNNLMVNCKFMAQTPSWSNPNPSNGADNASVIDYNFYASGTQQFGGMTAYDGYTGSNNNYWHDGRSDTPIVDEHSKVSASAGDTATDPKFVNYGFSTVALDKYTYDNSWDFAVQAGSPVLTGAYSNFTGAYTGYFQNTGLVVGGTEYKTPAPAARFGAFGTN